MSPLRRLLRLGRYSLLALLSLLLLISAFLWFITTNTFQEMVRSRLTAAIERATSGRVELGSFQVVPLRFQIEIRNLTIHGREGPGEVPLAHVDSMTAVVQLSSVLGANLAFHSLVLDHPVIHVRFYPDGSTNQPAPRQSNGASIKQLSAISIGRLEIHRGELLWQDDRVPLEFVGHELKAQVNYSFLHRRYSGNIAIGQAETAFDGYRPVSWSARTEFSAGRDEIHLRSLSASAGGSELQATGSINDLLHPVLKGTYNLRLNLREAAAVLREQRVTAGILQGQGTGSWSQQTFATEGNFDLRDAAFKDETFAPKDVTATGKFAIDPRRAAVSQVQGRILRGIFNADGEVLGWKAPEQRATKAVKHQQSGSINFKAKDLSLAELITELGPPFRLLKNLKMSGSISTSSRAVWKESLRNAEISSTVSVTRPTRSAARELPVSADTHFKYSARTGVLEIADFSARTPATQATAAGTVSGSSALKVSVATSDLREWQPLTNAVFPNGLPIAVAGHASFNGTVTGNVNRPMVAGNLQLQDFDTAPPPEVSQAPIHWDALNTDVQLSSANVALHNAHLRRDVSSIHLDGNLALSQWKTYPDSVLRLRVDATNADAGDLATLGGYKGNVTGKISARLDLSGTLAKPQGQGSVNWADGSWQGHRFDSAKVLLQLSGDRLTVHDAQILRGSSSVAGSGSYALANHHFQLDLSGSNFSLAELDPLERSRVKITGTLDFSAKLSGTLQNPDLEARLHLKNITFNEETAGDFRMQLTTHGTDLRLKGNSEFGKAELLVDGDVQLRGQWPAHINFHFNRLDIDSFLESYLHGHITGHSAVAGDLVLQGPLRNPQLLSLTGNLSELYADLEKVQIRNEGPIRFTVSKQLLTIDRLHIAGENTDFSAAGSMQLAGEKLLDLRGNGRLGLAILHTYDADLGGSGTISGEVAVTGTAQNPLVRGVLQIQDAGVSDINLPSAISELNGTLVFSQNQITIQKLTGRTGGGTVSFGGHAQLNGRQVSFDLTANADSVRLRYPPGVSSTATANVRWSGSTSGSLLSGDITIMKLGVTPGFDFASYLERSAESSALPQTDPVLNNIRLDLHVVTTPELQMQTSVLRLRGNADLRVRGNAAKPVLLGRADVFEGEAYFNGTKYRLERGGVTFGTSASSAGASVPVIDLEATTHVRDYDITLSITGPADHPKMNYRSEPPLPTNDIIGLLAFGQTSEESAQLQQTGQAAFSQQASNAMLAAALNATLNNRAQRLFGNSRIKIDPQGLATETSPTQNGPAVTIEQQVKDNLTLTYTTSVSQTSQQIIRGEYYVSRNVSIVVIRDQNGVISFDVKIRRRKR